MGEQRIGGRAGGLGRIVGVLSVMGLLASCALPPAIVIASYAIDVGSFVATGKTATDHGISLVAQQDCAVMRILEGPMCQDDPDYQVADAGVLQPLNETPGGLEPAGPQAGLPTPLSPLAAGGDRALLPQVVRLPNAHLLPSDLQVVRNGVVIRNNLLGGATYLADGMIPQAQSGTDG